MHLTFFYSKPAPDIPYQACFIAQKQASETLSNWCAWPSLAGLLFGAASTGIPCAVQQESRQSHSSFAAEFTAL